MTAEGYIAPPLSDALERLIQDRLMLERLAFRANVNNANSKGWVMALEWILQEAEAMKGKPPQPAGPRIVRQEQPRWDSTCHACGHVHQGEDECGVRMGSVTCPCSTKVTA